VSWSEPKIGAARVGLQRRSEHVILTEVDIKTCVDIKKTAPCAFMSIFGCFFLGNQ